MSGPDLDRNFYRVHAPETDEQADQHAAIRAQFGQLAAELKHAVPVGREREMAFANLEQAMFWANAAIARARYDGASRG